MSTNSLALNINDAVYEQINKVSENLRVFLIELTRYSLIFIIIHFSFIYTQIRAENSLAVLTAVESNEDFAYVFRQQCPFSFEFDIENEAALLENISGQINSSFQTESYSNRYCFKTMYLSSYPCISVTSLSLVPRRTWTLQWQQKKIKLKLMLSPSSTMPFQLK